MIETILRPLRPLEFFGSIGGIVGGISGILGSLFGAGGGGGGCGGGGGECGKKGGAASQPRGGMGPASLGARGAAAGGVPRGDTSMLPPPPGAPEDPNAQIVSRDPRDRKMEIFDI